MGWRDDVMSFEFLVMSASDPTQYSQLITQNCVGGLARIIQGGSSPLRQAQGPEHSRAFDPAQARPRARPRGRGTKSYGIAFLLKRISYLANKDVGTLFLSRASRSSR